jgi:hypothetical protein
MPFSSASNIAATGFSFRIPDAEFTVPTYPEASWQMMLADAGKGWHERPVMTPGGAESFPFPGAAWNTTVVASVKPVAYDPQTGIIKVGVEDPRPEVTYKGYVTSVSIGE